jgi:hypothetical protein
MVRLVVAEFPPGFTGALVEGAFAKRGYCSIGFQPVIGSLLPEATRAATYTQPATFWHNRLK